MTREQLFNAMVNGTPITIRGVADKQYVIHGIELEDGSGYNFNVIITSYNQPQVTRRTIFVRCPRPTNNV